MYLYLLIERHRNDENEWTLRGMFSSEKKAKNGKQILLEDEELDEDSVYYEIRKVECNKLDDDEGYLFGYHGLPEYKCLDDLL